MDRSACLSFAFGLAACYAPPPPEPTELRIARDDEDVKPAPTPLTGPAQQLRLEISLRRGLAVIEVGHPVEVDAKIRNVSPDPATIVLPGQGSAGGCDPHIRFSATRNTEDGPRALTPPVDRIDDCEAARGDGRIVTLPPGGEHTLDPRSGAVSRALEMHEPGRIHLTMQYEYRALVGTTPGVPAFTLVSNTLQFERTRPISLSIRPRNIEYRRPARKAADYHQLEAYNATDAPRELPPILSATMRLLGDPARGRAEERYEYDRGKARGKPRTAPLTIPPRTSVVTPDLAHFGFPDKSSWVEDSVPGVFEVRLEGLPEPVRVNMDDLNHGYAR